MVNPPGEEGHIRREDEHAQPSLDKSFIEDVGPRNFYLSGLFEMLPTRSAAQDVAPKHWGGATWAASHRGQRPIW
jgi:hypothetical protein